MDILIRAGKNITGDLSNWKGDEIRCFWRGLKPKNKIDKVYFLRSDEIIGYAECVEYGYSNEINIQGNRQEGNAFLLKNFVKVKPFKIPKEYVKGRWIWRYIRGDYYGNGKGWE